jgi:hypothetical protein
MRGFNEYMHHWFRMFDRQPETSMREYVEHIQSKKKYKRKKKNK